MWASSRTGLRGFRVSLARTATKEDCIEVQFSASEVIPCYRRAKHGTTSPPPPRPEGRVTPLCGLYWDVPLDRIRFLVSIGYGQYDRHSISFFCPKHVQGVKPAETPLHPNIYQKSPFLLPPPREWCYSAEPRLRDAECHEVSEAKLTEHSHSRTKCNNIICSGC